MLNKNKKTIIAGAVVFVLVVAALSTFLIIVLRNRQSLSQLGEVRKAASLDEYVETDSKLMHKKNMEPLQLSRKEVVPPVPTRIDLRKITMTPVLVEGGDAVYEAVGELPGKNFFRLEPENLNKIFSISSPDQALKYIDFLMVATGRSSYDRVRTTVWKTSDYDKIGCKVMPDDENLPLPTDRPVSQAKVSGDGFEVDWVYFTPALPAGYHQMIIQVEKDGGFTIKDSPEKPFWPCGGGFVF